MKRICEKELRKKITAENAVDLLIFLDLHQANDLKVCAIRFINKNAPAVMKTPLWINFSETPHHQHLIVKLYCKLVDDKCNKTLEVLY